MVVYDGYAEGTRAGILILVAADEGLRDKRKCIFIVILIQEGLTGLLEHL